jgi:hypothetical protein
MRFTAAYVHMIHGKLELYGVFESKVYAQEWINRIGLKLGEPGINRGDPKLWEVLEIQRVKAEN